MKRVNLITSIIFLAMGAAIYWESSQFKQTMLKDKFSGPGFFPKLVAVLMIATALFLIINSLLEKEESKEKIFDSSIKLALIGMAIILVYIASLNSLGFIIATILLNYAFLFLFRVKGKLVLLLQPALTSLIIYWIFAKLLFVPLPEGLFFI